MEHSSEKRAEPVKRHYQYHLRLIGNAGVGKSALTRRITEDSFSSDYKYDRHVVCDWVSFPTEPSIPSYTQLILPNSIQLRTKVETETAVITLLHCDTAGQERFGRLCPNFYRGVHCVCVVFDLTDTNSLESAADWLNDVSEYAPHAVRFLVGNKCDLEKEKPDPAGAASLAKDFGARYFEVSSASRENVNQLLAATATETRSNVKGNSGPDVEGIDIGVKTRAACY
ncbi:P-loop containing nucleoside triphosphate hydrolase protein [Aspergillus germanicus]